MKTALIPYSFIQTTNLSIPNRETRALKKSGNYLLRIFNDDGEIVFSRKFMVLERLLKCSR